MNERIRQLAEQATTQKQIVAGDEFQLAMSVEFFDKEKFAELIVRECMQIANTYQNRGGNIYVDNKIAEHFGVEE